METTTSAEKIEANVQISGAKEEEILVMEIELSTQLKDRTSLTITVMA